jgi:hypothetical protein
MKNIENSNYKVDILGNIYGLNGNKLKPAIDKKGYLRVGLMLNKKLCTKKVHRLVALAFIENPLNKATVNHINGIKNDNRVENLEWNTYKENTKHAIDNNLFYFNTSDQSVNKIIKRGSLNGNALLTENKVIEIRKKYKPRIYTRIMLALEYNVKQSCIKDIVNRNSWKHI